MRIVCPICSATYEVRDALLAPGRAVRCARCGEEWAAIPTTPPPPAESPPEASPKPAPEPVPPAAAAPPPREPPAAAPMPAMTAMERLASRPATMPRAATGLGVAWVASLVLLAVIGWGIAAWRADIMQAWPPSIRLYDWLGLVPAPPAPPAR